MGRDHCESSCRESSYRGLNHRWLSHQRCDVNKKQGRFGERKNDVEISGSLILLLTARHKFTIIFPGSIRWIIQLGLQHLI